MQKEEAPRASASPVVISREPQLPVRSATLVREKTRPVYRHSVIAGGAYSVAELERARHNDSVVDAHYQIFNAAKLHMSKASKARAVYVSYRVDNKVYWTRKRVELASGEALISDGEHEARARCGNRISDTPQEPVSRKEPAIAELDLPGPPPLEEGDALPASVLMADIFPPQDPGPDLATPEVGAGEVAGLGSAAGPGIWPIAAGAAGLGTMAGLGRLGSGLGNGGPADPGPGAVDSGSGANFTPPVPITFPIVPPNPAPPIPIAGPIGGGSGGNPGSGGGTGSGSGGAGGATGGSGGTGASGGSSSGGNGGAGTIPLPPGGSTNGGTPGGGGAGGTGGTGGGSTPQHSSGGIDPPEDPIFPGSPNPPNEPVTVTPEPSTWIILVAGVAIVLFKQRSVFAGRL